VVKQIQQKVSSHRRRIVPALVALSLLSGVMVSLLSTPSAQADYYKAADTDITPAVVASATELVSRSATATG